MITILKNQLENIMSFVTDGFVEHHVGAADYKKAVSLLSRPPSGHTFRKG